MIQTEMRKTSKAMAWHAPTDPCFSYEGRIDFECPEAPTFVNPCSYFRFRLGGKRAALALENQRAYFENALGVLVDGEYRGKILLHDGTSLQGETAEQFLLRLLSMEEERLSAIKGLKESVRFYDLGN